MYVYNATYPHHYLCVCNIRSGALINRAKQHPLHYPQQHYQQQWVKITSNINCGKTEIQVSNSKPEAPVKGLENEEMLFICV